MWYGSVAAKESRERLQRPRSVLTANRRPLSAATQLNVGNQLKHLLDPVSRSGFEFASGRD